MERWSHLEDEVLYGGQGGFVSIMQQGVARTEKAMRRELLLGEMNMFVIEMYPFVSNDGGIDLYEARNAPKSNDTYLFEPF